jgi:hypothetical protein
MTAPLRKSLTFWERFSEPQSVISFLFLYCALNFLVRAVVTPNFTLDEAEQMLFSQTLQWNYRSGHAPLITWLSWASFAATGGSRTAFLLLKYVVMALGLMAYFSAARIVIRDTRYAALATFALLATFSMGYLPLIDKPQIVLLATMAAAYMWADARVLARGTWLDHLVLGVISGFGILSGYIFLVLPVALGIGAVLTPYLRVRLKPLPLLLAGVVAIAIAAPYVMRTGYGGTDISSAGWVRDMGGAVLAMVTFVLPAALAFPLLYWRACKPLEDVQADLDDRAWLRACETALIAGFLIVLGVIFFADSEPFRTGGPYAAMLMLPIYAFLRVKITGADDRSNRIFIAFVGVLALAVIGTRIAVFETHADSCKACREYWPMPTYSDGLRQAGFQQGTILAASYDLAGNLRYRFAQSRVVTPGFAPGVFGPDPGGECLVVWEGEKDLPKSESAYLSNALHARPTSASMRGDITVKLLNSKKRFDTMSYILLRPGACH